MLISFAYLIFRAKIVSFTIFDGMQKIILNIKDQSRLSFLLELLEGLDYVEVEQENSIELSPEHTKILDERLARHKTDPDEGDSWENVKERLLGRR